MLAGMPSMRVFVPILALGVPRPVPFVDKRTGKRRSSTSRTKGGRNVDTYKGAFAAVFRNAVKAPWDGPVAITFCAVIRPPKIRLKALREVSATWHVQVPDGDNITKGIWDAAKGVLWRDDRQVSWWSGAKLESLALPVGVHVHAWPIDVAPEEFFGREWTTMMGQCGLVEPGRRNA